MSLRLKKIEQSYILEPAQFDHIQKYAKFYTDKQLPDSLNVGSQVMIPSDSKQFEIYNDSDSHVGDLLVKDLGYREAEISITIYDEFNRRKYATDATKLISNILFEENQFDCIRAKRLSDSIAAEKVLRSNGFTKMPDDDYIKCK